MSMDEALVDPSTVGYKFVEQYYDVLNRNPSMLHRFYAPEASVLSHGVEGEPNDPAKGQQEINQLIMNMLATDTGCKSVITQADCQYGPGRSTIMIQVIGYLGSEESVPMRKFCQTFCLQKEGGSDGKIRYSIHNDIFRYLKEDGADESVSGEEPDTVAAGVPNGEAMDHEEAVEPPSDGDGTELLKEVEASSVMFSGMMDNLDRVVLDQVVEVAAAVELPVDAPAPAPAAVAAPEPAAPETSEATVIEPPAPEKSKPKGPFSYASAIAKPATRPASVPAKPVGARTQAPRPVKSVSPSGASSGAAAAATATADGDAARGPRASGDTGHNLSLYVRGLPTECTEEDLENTFAEYGAVAKPRGVAIYPNKNPPKNPSQPHGRYAFVDFEEKDACARCLTDVEGGKTFSVCGRKIFVLERMNDRSGGRGTGRGARGGRGDGRGGRRGGGRRGGRGARLDGQ
eukprot:m.68035 g.68035  ORF g.68035 m.68035 type:complete len:459 (+) comp18275_c0_seq1:139-1515(+)